MHRLALSFSLLFLLVVGLLAYFLRSAYLEERQVLVERIESDIRERKTDWLVNQVRGLKGITVNESQDSFISLRLTGTPARDAPATHDTPWTRVSVDTGNRWTVTRKPQATEPAFPSQTINLRSSIDPNDLDTLSARYGVTLVNFSSRADAERAGALPIRNVNQRNTFFGRSGKVVGMLNYRWTLLGGLGYEAGFAVLLLAAIGFAFYTAFGSLEEHQRQLREREALIANVAHELKTPIATVGVALEAMDSFGADLEPTRRREYLNSAAANSGDWTGWPTGRSPACSTRT